MSGQDTSEEKSLPASEKKLQDARKKAQIATSRDMISAALFVILLLYVLLAWPYILSRFSAMFGAAAKAAIAGGRGAWIGATRETWSAMSDIVTPLMVLSILAIVLGALISNRGVVISFHPIKPDLSRIHPVQGFKKLFSIRNFVEFVKALVKSMLLLTALGLLAYSAMRMVMRLPICGSDCVGPGFRAAVLPMLAAALGLFILAAMIDMLLQRWLFMRDMRMTHTEAKRERKEMFGDPTVRGQRQTLRRELAYGDAPARKSLKSREPTLVICASITQAVGLRYVRGETVAPVVIAKANTAEAVRALIESALGRRAPVVTEPELAATILRGARLDEFAPEAAFRDLARVLNQTGAVNATE